MPTVTAVDKSSIRRAIALLLAVVLLCGLLAVSVAQAGAERARRRSVWRWWHVTLFPAEALLFGVRDFVATVLAWAASGLVSLLLLPAALVTLGAAGLERIRGGSRRPPREPD